ncbi:hypothetical protein ACFWY6_10830 [Streptomyces sp. NPDC059037]|uniref:hypothetical protein n=1 Tax=Streptomyces sp. NPDC059037 TaxID=3346710 RepID=UPI0036C11C0F
MPNAPHINNLRARLAAHERWHPDDPETADDVRRELKTTLAEEYIRRIVETAPVPTSEQLDRLRALLPPVSEDGGDQNAA